jgi:hypothetical protein
MYGFGVLAFATAVDNCLAACGRLCGTGRCELLFVLQAQYGMLNIVQGCVGWCICGVFLRCCGNTGTVVRVRLALHDSPWTAQQGVSVALAAAPAAVRSTSGAGESND